MIARSPGRARVRASVHVLLALCARVERVDKARLPVDSLFDRRGGPRLTLVTCGGEFDQQARSYRDNVVVVAVPAGR